MTYTPNFNDPRVQRKIKHALGWACANLRYDTPKNWAKVKLDNSIGHNHHSLGRYLRNTLLIEHNSHYNMLTGKTKQWRLNLKGVFSLSESLGITPPVKASRITHHVAVELLSKQHAHTLNTGAFEYIEKSNRLWNDLQFVRNDVRKQLFKRHGYCWEFDIRSAAPTILLQYARRICDLTKPTVEIDRYLQDPGQYRQRLADQLGIDYNTAKSIITARFNGATLRHDRDISKMLGNNRIQLYKLKKNSQFVLLTKDIKKITDSIKKFHQIRGRMSAGKKWEYYHLEEKRVMGVVRKALEQNKCKYFLEHDGWRSDAWIDPHELKLRVRKQTGYVIDFKWEQVT